MRHARRRSKTGAVRLALLTGAPIVPVALVGAHRVVGTSHVVTRLLRNTLLRPTVRVAVGEAIDVRRLAGVGADDELDEAQLRRATDEVMAELIALVAELRGETPPYPTGVPEDQLGRQTTTD